MLIQKQPFQMSHKTGVLNLKVSRNSQENNYWKALENINKSETYEAKDLRKIYIKPTWNLKQGKPLALSLSD